MFTFQRACILDLFDATGKYVPTWDGIGISEKDRLAYSHANRHLLERGMSDGKTPPVWTFECNPEELDLLAELLLSEHEMETFEYVTLELSVPVEHILRTSYGDWCELYFSILETGRIEHNGRWLECPEGSASDEVTVQTLLPYVLESWIVSQKRLCIEESN